MKQSSLQSLAGIAVVRNLGRMRLAALVLALLTLSFPALAEEDTDGTLSELSIAHKAMIDVLVTGKLRDPRSAQFRNVRMIVNGGTSVVCGEVNARNGYGGYNGFEPFSIRSYPGGQRLVLVAAHYPLDTRQVIRRGVSREGC